MSSGKQAIYPHSLIDSWLNYRIKGKNETLTSIIKEVNFKLGRKYDNHSFWLWRSRLRNTPDEIVEKIIKKEIKDVLAWYFREHDASSVSVDFELLGGIFTGSIDDNSLKELFKLMGFQSKKIDCRELSEAFSI